MSLPYKLLPQIGSKARLGFVVLQSDETIENELRQVFPVGDVASFTSRIPSSETVSRKSLAKMEGALTGAAALLPSSVDFDVVGYGCTSASSVIGAQRVAELIGEGCVTSQVTDPVSALIAACKTLGVSKLALLTPYSEQVSEALRQTLRSAGIETPVFGSFNEPIETHVARIDPKSIREAAVKLGKDSGAEAVFMSCTNLRTLDVLQDVETSCAKPALSSNQVLFWHMFELAGLRPARTDGGLWSSRL